MLTTQSLRHNFKVEFVSAHVRRLFNDYSALDVYVGGATALLESNSVVDAVGPVEAEGGNDALPTILVLKETFVSTVVVHICDDVVEDNDDHIEVPSKSLELLRVLVDEEGSLDIVDLAILLDEVFTDGMDVVDDNQLQLLLISSSC